MPVSARYSEARSMNRKVVFHAGPTNSGKTYHAMEQFLRAESAVYCGPLKLLANEVFNKTNDKVRVDQGQGYVGPGTRLG